MLKFYCFITGDDYKIVKNETPASRKKIALMASSLLVPVLLWFVNGYLLVLHVLAGSQTNALITAFAVAFLIFLIERSIIMANGSKVIAFFRIFVGLIVAVLGSISIDEVIFKNDIDHQVQQNKEAFLEKERKEATARFQREIDEQKSAVAFTYQKWQKSLQDVKDEMKGGPGGSGMKGVGAIAKVDLQLAKLQEEEYKQKVNEHSALEEKVKQAQIKATTEGAKSYSEHSLLIRIKAMFDLVQNDTWMMVVYTFFTLLLFCLEFLVVILKLTLNKTNYERKVALIEQIGNDRMNRIAEKDPTHFDTAKYQPSVQKAKQEVQRPSPTLFS